jgi:hypothetical protein
MRGSAVQLGGGLQAEVARDPVGRFDGRDSSLLRRRAIYRPRFSGEWNRRRVLRWTRWLMRFCDLRSRCSTNTASSTPIAAALDSSGELQMVAADPGDEHPDSSELIPLLYERLRHQASRGEIRAADDGRDQGRD